jgi:subtilisin family serine protease
LRNPTVLRIEADPKRYPLAQTTPFGISMVQAPAVVAGADIAAIKVCVIDSGYALGHEDLPGAGIAAGDNDPGSGNWFEDGCGHGTHVTGIIAALDNTAGVLGVIPTGTVPLHIVRTFGNNCSWTYSSDLVAALGACRSAGAQVVNMSLGGALPSTTEQRAFDDAWAAGMLPIAAAGNSGASGVEYPAGYSSVLSVAAIDSNKVVASFSQQNADVELAAPGVDVLSTVPWTNANTLTVAGKIYFGNWIENAARSAGVTGELVDGGVCTSPGPWSGKVVLCARDGIVTFLDKVTNVQNGSGVAAVIYNNAPGNFTGTLGTGSSTIPAISLSQEDGQFLVANSLTLSAEVVSNYDPTAGGYAVLSGTSMAAPHVSGVAALIWSHNRLWTNVQIRAALRSAAQDLGPAGPDTAYGYGLVQAGAALEYLNALPPGPPAPSDLTLAATAYKFRGRKRVDLTWSGAAAAAQVDVFRDGVFLVRTANDGAYSDAPAEKGSASYTYRVCAVAGTPACSNDVVVSF